MSWVVKLRLRSRFGKHYLFLPWKGEELTNKLVLAARYDSEEQAEKMLKEILEDNPQFEGKAEKCKK